MQEVYDLINNYEITVEQHHIDYMQNEWETWPGYSNRRNCDSLLLEYDLQYRGLVDRPTHIAHDFIKYIYNPQRRLKVDLKEIGKWHNIDEGKLHWMKSCVSARDVTHYLTYRARGRDKTRLYICGDKVTIEAIEIREAREYLKRANRSQYSGHYITPLLYLHSDENVLQ